MPRQLFVGCLIVVSAAAAALLAGCNEERPVAWRIEGTVGEGARILVTPSRDPDGCETYEVEVLAETPDTVELRVLEKEEGCSGDTVGEVAPVLSAAPARALDGRRVVGVDLVEARVAPVAVSGNSLPAVFDRTRGLPDSRGLAVDQARGVWFEYGIRPAISGPTDQAVVVRQTPAPRTAPELPIGRTSVVLRTIARPEGP